MSNGLQSAKSLGPPIPQQALSQDLLLSETSSQWTQWSDCLRCWLAKKERASGSQHTLRAYRTAWTQFFEYTKIPPWNVTPEHAQAWAMYMSSMGLSDSTVNTRLSALSSFYTFASTQYTVLADNDQWMPLYTGANPFRCIERPKTKLCSQSNHLTCEEVARILSVIRLESPRGWRDMALLLGLYVTARWPSEWLHLQWGDIRNGEGGYTFHYRGRDGQIRIAPLPWELWLTIQGYLKRVGWWESMSGDDYIFRPLDPTRAARLGMPVVQNKPISSATANRILKKHARRAGVDEEKCQLRALRHAAARRLSERGASLAQIGVVLGHADVGTTRAYMKRVLGAVASAQASTLLFDEVAPCQLKQLL